MLKKWLKQRCLPGVLLIVLTVVSLVIANSKLGGAYHHVLNEIKILGEFNIHMMTNDFLMAIFFLFVGLEIKHEILHGNLSSFKKASFPIVGALGGVLVPAIIFLLFNANTEFASGVGVPISTDIAFAIGVFMILRNKLNPSLKIFLLSLAVVDDLISILVIGILYSSGIKIEFLLLSAITLGILILVNKKKIDNMFPYMLLGLILWFFVYSSGVHATISGVLLAITIPSEKLSKTKKPMLQRLEKKLEPLCNLLILPLFALVNTAISLSLDVDYNMADTLMIGIIMGLVIGKPLGIMLFTWLGTKLHVTEKPESADWLSILLVSLLAGIGFTMSIFVAEIAFANNELMINISIISILCASTISIIITYIISTIAHEHKKNTYSFDKSVVNKKGIFYNIEDLN
ncbi:MAG: Na+/H+ antiporter NhaA [Romboutsia sp.]|uniref:Na+/H+ antiporter NhaA n=1 Tax=Romboutsia sp. TaxID=1965302 RepID=UPI003F2DA7D6